MSQSLRSLLAMITLGVFVNFAPCGDDSPKKQPSKSGEPKKEAPAGKTVNGLQLSLSTDKAEVGVKGGKRAALRLTFTNVGDKPIKLNTDDFRWLRIRGEIKADPVDSVEHHLAVADRKLTPLTAAVFPELKPGQSWSFDTDLTFPGFIPQGKNAFEDYSVVKPGKFRIKFTYTSKDIDNPLAKGIWTGELVSNEVTIVAP